jgi:hypothetical protein
MPPRRLEAEHGPARDELARSLPGRASEPAVAVLRPLQIAHRSRRRPVRGRCRPGHRQHRREDRDQGCGGNSGAHGAARGRRALPAHVEAAAEALEHPHEGGAERERQGSVADRVRKVERQRDAGDREVSLRRRGGRERDQREQVHPGAEGEPRHRAGPGKRDAAGAPA